MNYLQCSKGHISFNIGKFNLFLLRTQYVYGKSIFNIINRIGRCNHSYGYSCLHRNRDGNAERRPGKGGLHHSTARNQSRTGSFRRQVHLGNRGQGRSVGRQSVRKPCPRGQRVHPSCTRQLRQRIFHIHIGHPDGGGYL